MMDCPNCGSTQVMLAAKVNGHDIEEKVNPEFERYMCTMCRCKWHVRLADGKRYGYK